MLRPPLAALSALALTALLGACAAPPAADRAAAAPPPPPADAFAGPAWLLVAADGAPVAPGGRLVFTPMKNGVGRFNGRGPCNDLRGEYQADGPRGGGFTVGAILSTKRTCPAIADENAMIDVLILADAARIENGRMTISEAGGRSLEFAEERPAGN